MPNRRSANTVERKIYFYRADIGNDDSGCPLAFDPQPAFKIIDGLPFADGFAGRYQVDTDGNAVCLIVHDRGLYPTVQFCRVRRTGLPLLEKAGQIRGLELDPEAGLLEAVHVVFFPSDTGGTIVGSEYNHFGPRISRLSGYLHSKCNREMPSVNFHPLIRRELSEQLERLSEVRVLEMSIRPAYAETIKQADQSLGEAFEANARVFNDQENVQLVLSPQQQSRQNALNRFKSVFRQLLRRQDLYESTKRFQIRGKCIDTDRVETIDLLRAQLIATKRIVRLNERSRALNPNSAFQAIHEAYQELQSDLSRAATISL